MSMHDYRPARREYGHWTVSTIHREAPRERVADWLRTIRRQDGNAQAIAFRDYLLWLGTYPVIFHLRYTKGCRAACAAKLSDKRPPATQEETR